MLKEIVSDEENWIRGEYGRDKALFHPSLKRQWISDVTKEQRLVPYQYLKENNY